VTLPAVWPRGQPARAHVEERARSIVTTKEFMIQEQSLPGRDYIAGLYRTLTPRSAQLTFPNISASHYIIAGGLSSKHSTLSTAFFVT
jgi:hypothetical protein